MTRGGLDPNEGLAYSRGWAGSVVIAGVWLVYLANPLQAIWRHPSGFARDLGLVALLAFAVTYIALFDHMRRTRRRTGRFVADAPVLGLLVVLVLLVAAMVPAAGPAALAGMVYVSAATMMTLPTRVAWVLVGALLLLTEGSAQLVPGWHDEAGSGLGVLLAAVAVFGIRLAMERNRQLTVARGDLARLAMEEERSRFARDLHDILGHSLTVVTVKAELAGRLVHADPERASREIDDIERLSREALADVRSALAGYRDVTLVSELASARAALSAAGIVADLPGAVDDVHGPSRQLFGWAVREGVTNVVRHSGARTCTVRVSPYRIEIVDDGRGPAGAPRQHTVVNGSDAGHGLAGLRERAASLGGAVTTGAAGPDGGFRLSVALPEAHR